MSNTSEDPESLQVSGIYDSEQMPRIDLATLKSESAHSRWLLKLGATALFWIYLGLAILHGVVLSGSIRTWMVSLSVISSLTGAVMIHRWRNRLPESAHTKRWLRLLLAVPAVNSLAHMYLAREIMHSTNMLLIIVASGYVFIRKRDFLKAIVVQLAATVAVMIAIQPQPDTVHFLVMLVLSVILAVLIHRARAHIGAVEERLNLAIGSADLGYFDWTLPGGELHWDDRMHQLFDLPVHSRINRHDHFLASIHPDDRERVTSQFAEALSPDNPLNAFRSAFRISNSAGVAKAYCKPRNPL